MFNNSTFIIAEIAQAHEGSLGIAHSYIDALANTGVNAVKFQTHIADAESSEHENFRINFSYEDVTRFDYWKRMEFTIEQWDGLKKHCDDLGLEFISSPFSCAAVDLLEKIGVNKYKIGSGETSNFLMLQKIAETGKDILLSSGMSSFSEIDETLNFLKPFKNNIALFQCTTEYPTSPDTWGLNVITEMKSKYQLPIGFSDHLYSSHTIGTFQFVSQSCTNFNVASFSLPVFAKQTVDWSGNCPPPTCNTLCNIYALVLPPEKLITVGSRIV